MATGYYMVTRGFRGCNLAALPGALLLCGPPQCCFPIPKLEKKQRSEIFNEYFRFYVYDSQPAIKT